MLCSSPLVWSSRLMWLPSAVKNCTYIRQSNDPRDKHARVAKVDDIPNNRHARSDRWQLAEALRAFESKHNANERRNTNGKIELTPWILITTSNYDDKISYWLFCNWISIIMWNYEFECLRWTSWRKNRIEKNTIKIQLQRMLGNQFKNWMWLYAFQTHFLTNSGEALLEKRHYRKCASCQE